MPAPSPVGVTPSSSSPAVTSARSWSRVRGGSSVSVSVPLGSPSFRRLAAMPVIRSQAALVCSAVPYQCNQAIPSCAGSQ
jgi:hypothetical protein